MGRLELVRLRTLFPGGQAAALVSLVSLVLHSKGKAGVSLPFVP